MQASERFHRFHWLYWSAYRTVIDPVAYKRLFNRDLEDDFRIAITLAKEMHFLHVNGNSWRLTDRGADWVHRLQSLYSLSFIDQLWTKCKEEPWLPRAILYDSLLWPRRSLS